MQTLSELAFQRTNCGAGFALIFQQFSLEISWLDALKVTLSITLFPESTCLLACARVPGVIVCV